MAILKYLCLVITLLICWLVLDLSEPFLAQFQCCSIGETFQGQVPECSAALQCSYTEIKSSLRWWVWCSAVKVEALGWMDAGVCSLSEWAWNETERIQQHIRVCVCVLSNASETVAASSRMCACVNVCVCLCLRRIAISGLGSSKSQALRECVCTCGFVCCRSIPLLIDCRLVLADADERSTAFHSRSSARQRAHKQTLLKHAFVMHSISKRT